MPSQRLGQVIKLRCGLARRPPADAESHDDKGRDYHRDGQEPEPGAVRARMVADDTDNCRPDPSTKVAAGVDQPDGCCRGRLRHELAGQCQKAGR